MKTFIANFAARGLVRDVEQFPEMITDEEQLQRYEAALNGRSTTLAKSLRGAVKFGASKEHNEFSENARLAKYELVRIWKHERAS